MRISSHLFEKLNNTCRRNTTSVANFAEVIVLSKVVQHLLYANVMLCCNISHVTSYRNRKTWLHRVKRITLWPFCTWLNNCHGKRQNQLFGFFFFYARIKMSAILNFWSHNLSLIYSISITTLVKKEVNYFLLGGTWTDLFYVEFLDVREKKKFRNLLELLIFSFQARGQSFSSSTVCKSWSCCIR